MSNRTDHGALGRPVFTTSKRCPMSEVLNVLELQSIRMQSQDNRTTITLELEKKMQPELNKKYTQENVYCCCVTFSFD